MNVRCKAASLAVAAMVLCGAPLAPVHAQTPAAPPPPAAAPAPAEGLKGEEVTLTEKTIVYLKGTANWDSAFETLVTSFKTVKSFLDKQGIKPAGPLMTIYTATDDTGFQFQAAIPVSEPPKEAPKGDMHVGTSPSGKAFKFVHEGSYDSMDNIYEAITNFLDERKLEARDVFMEEYATDPLVTAEDKMVVNVFVPVK